MRYMIMGVLLGVIGFITACGGGSNSAPTSEPVANAPESTPATAPAAGLPSLDELPRTAAESAVTQLNGADYLDDALRARVERDDDTAVFTPAGTAFDSAAYATYAFNLTGVTGSQDMVFEYLDAWGFTASPPCCYVSLANWQQTQWDWFPLGEIDNVRIGDPTPYTHPEDGTCIVVLVYMLEGTIQLNSLGFEPSPSPEPAVESVFPTLVISGNETIFSATVTGAGPFAYHWDFGGGASPNTSSDAMPRAVPGSTGDYECCLTVTNSSGSTDFTFTLEVIDTPGDWVHTYGITNTDSICWVHDLYGASTARPITTDSNGYTIFADNRVIPPDPEFDYDMNIVKVTPAGDVAWAYTYRIVGITNHYLEVSDLWVDHDNNIYLICLSHYANADDLYVSYLFKLDQAGSPLWATTQERIHATYGHGGSVIHGVCDSQNNVLLLGNVINPEHSTHICSILTKVTPEGQYVNHSAWASPHIDPYGAICGSEAFTMAITDDDCIYIAGTIFQNHHWMGYLTTLNGPSGNCNYIHTPFFLGELSINLNSQQSYLAAQNGISGIHAFDTESLEPHWQYLIESGISDEQAMLCCLDDGSLLLCGYTVNSTEGEGDRYPYLHRFNPDGTLAWSREWGDGVLASEFTGLTTMQDGSLMILGRNVSSSGIWVEDTANTEFHDYEYEVEPIALAMFDVDPPALELRGCYRIPVDYVLDPDDDVDKVLLIHTTL